MRRNAAWVGRDRELAVLDEHLTQALRGRSGGVLVVGEAGIGKTRLLEETAERALTRGFMVAWGRGWELGEAPAFWPWLEVLRALLSRAAAPAAAARRLQPLLPEPNGGPRFAGADVFQLYDAAHHYLQEHSAVEPLALLFDDLHAADASSLALAEFVVQRLGERRIVLFGSQRQPSAMDPDVEQRLTRLGRTMDRMHLERLSRDDVAEWLRQVRGVTDAHRARQVHETTGGNPLFVSELLELPQPLARGELPATVRAAIRERMIRLEPIELRLLAAAAIVGSEFTLPVVAEVADAALPELTSAVHEACRIGVLSAGEPGRYSFSHALVAETLVLDLQPSQRAALHRRAAEALERRHQNDPAAPVNEIARHWLEAGTDAAPLALAAAERAARHAFGQLAFADAAFLYERALSAAALIAPSDPRQRAELGVAWVEALARAGRREVAEAACAEVVELAQGLGDGALLARAALALGAENTIGSSDGHVVRLLERALPALPPGDAPLRALVMARLASARQPEADPEPPMQLARAAVAMARRLGDDRVTLPVLHAALGALMDFAPAEERSELNARALDLARRLGDRPRALQAAQRLAFDRLELGDCGGFESALSSYELLAAEVEQPRYAWVPAMFRAMRADWEGDAVAADRWGREARRLREQGGGEGARLVPARPLARALLRVDGAELERFAGALAERTPESAAVRLLFALLDAWQGRSEDARERLRELAARGFGRFVGRGDGSTGAARALPPAESNELVGLGYLQMPEIAVELACALGDAGWAEALYAELAPAAGTAFLLTTTAFSLHGVVDHALLRLSAVCGRWPMAERHAQGAVALCERLGARPILARVQRDRALAALVAQRQTRSETERAALAASATRLLEEAAAIADELGWRPFSERCRGTLAELAGVSTPSPPGALDAALHVAADGPRAHAELGVRLTLEGEYWTLSSGDGPPCRVRDSRGMRMLAQLIERPGHELHVLELSGSPTGADRSDAGELLDARARAEYQARLRELGHELDEAESFNDLARRERLEAEREALVRELSRGFGLGGRQRRAASAVERARVNVRRRLLLALRHIRAASPELGGELEAALRTGVHCVYDPRPTREPS